MVVAVEEEQEEEEQQMTMDTCRPWLIAEETWQQTWWRWKGVRVKAMAERVQVWGCPGIQPDSKQGTPPPPFTDPPLQTAANSAETWA